MQNNADFKWLCHEWFHHVRHYVPDGHSIRWLAALRELPLVNRNTRLLNGYMADLKIMPTRLKNGFS